MFTGIVEELGRVDALERGTDSARLTIGARIVTSDAGHGASIAVNGVCLTVVEHDEERFTVDVMAETLNRSSLGGLDVGDPVNLERAMAAGGRFGGHVVQGHVDGTATLLERVPGDRWELVRLRLGEGLSRYVVEKGSITLDGVSLTVAAVEDDVVTVSLIPTTLDLTRFGTAVPGAVVNVEVDVLAKYVERLLAPGLAGTGAPAAEPGLPGEPDLPGEPATVTSPADSADTEERP